MELLLEVLAALEELKMYCMTALLLAFAFAYFEEPMLLETDALVECLCAVFYQLQDDGKYHLVAYASWGLKGAEVKYCSLKRQFLPLKWAVTEQFKEYL